MATFKDVPAAGAIPESNGKTDCYEHMNLVHKTIYDRNDPGKRSDLYFFTYFLNGEDSIFTTRAEK